MNKEQVIEFLYNKDNICNCEHCPYNEGMSHESGNPCGQYNCWVEIHCARNEEEENWKFPEWEDIHERTRI